MGTYLISVPELHEELGEVDLFDVRWSLTDPTGGVASYRAGHVPGAVFVDLDRDLSDPEAGGGRHPLPSPADFAATLGRLGVGPRSDVVVYDDVGGGIAARMWWMVRAIGHRGTVRLLDGGFRAWADSGYEVATGEVEPVATEYPPPAHGFSGVATIEDVAAPGRLLLDARAPERYRGAEEPIDPKAGHIPGAINVPWQSTLTADGRFVDPAALRRRFAEFGADRRPVVVSCGSGVTACQLAVALEMAGLPRPLLYPGSFSEWAGTDRPVVTGPEPR